MVRPRQILLQNFYCPPFYVDSLVLLKNFVILLKLHVFKDLLHFYYTLLHSGFLIKFYFATMFTKLYFNMASKINLRYPNLRKSAVKTINDKLYVK